MTETGLGKRVAAGAAWMVFQRVAVRAIGLISTIVLARLLVPEDFGIIALATGMFSALDALLELGFDMALIQNQSDGRARYNTAWTLGVLRGVVAAIILLAVAYPTAVLYEDQRLVMVMAWLAVVAVVNGLQNIGVVEFRKELQFDREFQLLVWSKVAGFVVTVTLAWVWRDYRALIAGIVVSKAAVTAMTYVMHPYRPSWSLKGARGFLHFSKWLALNNTVVVIRTRLDTFIVGKIAGTEALGFYAVGYEISNLTTTELISPISRVLFPSFSKIAGDVKRLARSFIDSLAAMAFLAVPVAVGIALTAPHLVTLFLGPRWMTIVPLIQILTIAGLLNLASANSGALYLALGRPDLIVWRNLPSIVVLIPGLIWGVRAYGIEGAAWALVASAAVNFVANYWLVRRELGVGLRETISAILRPLLAAAVMFAVLAYWQTHWPPETGLLHLIPQLVILAATGAAIYGVMILALWIAAGRPAGAEQRVVLLLKGFLASKAAGLPSTPGTDQPTR